MGWINFSGLIVIVLMLIPNIVYSYKNKDAENKCTNKIINIIEQIGRYSSMFLMIFNIGILEFGFYSKSSFIIWLFSIIILILLYLIFWVAYFRINNFTLAMALAIIPSLIFIGSGFILRHYLLAISGIIFAISHIYITYENNK